MQHSLEMEFILGCLRRKYNDQAYTQWKTFASRPPDWETVLGLVSHARIVGPFFQQLQARGLDRRLSPQIRRQFETLYYKTGYRNTMVVDHLFQLVRLLAEAGIQAVLLKGMALLAEVWRNPSMREMGDIDLLVRKKDLGESEKLLVKAGFVPLEDHWPAEYYRKNHHHLVPYLPPKARLRIPFEVHHNIRQPTCPEWFSMDDFWGCSRIIQFRNHSLRVLSPEHLLIHLCTDLAYNKRFINAVRYMLDISQVVSHFGNSLQWDRIAKASGHRSAANSIYYSLYFSKILLGAAIPHNVLEAIRKKIKVARVSHYLLRYLVRNYCMVSPETPPLIPVYKLKYIFRDIIAAKGIATTFRNFWNEALFPESWSGVDGKRGAPHRVAFFIQKTF